MFKMIVLLSALRPLPVVLVLSVLPGVSALPTEAVLVCVTSVCSLTSDYWPVSAALQRYPVLQAVQAQHGTGREVLLGADSRRSGKVLTGEGSDLRLQLSLHLSCLCLSVSLPPPHPGLFLAGARL